jgi:hypothetical protein
LAYTTIPLYLGKTALDFGIELRWHAAFWREALLREECERLAAKAAPE